jgi:hypothetical protein
MTMIHKREFTAEVETHWIAYGPGVARGRLDPGASINTGKEVLEVFTDASAFAARLTEIEADLDAALRAARALPSAPLDVLAHHRWMREVGGFRMPNGISVRTDPATQNKLGNFTGQYLAGNVPERIDWKTPDGFLQLTREQVVEIASAVTAHVTLCFALEKRIAEEMAALEQAEKLEGLDPVAAFDAAYETEARAQGIIA